MLLSFQAMHQSLTRYYQRIAIEYAVYAIASPPESVKGPDVPN